MEILRKSEIFVPVTKIQVKSKSDMTFSCYTNVKGNIDHAQDMTMDGAYQDSINKHKSEGTMPKMFWNHQSWMPPVGGWLKMEEDEHGLYKEGRMLDTDRGIEIFKAMQVPGGVDSFSIGYYVLEEEWNGKFNELHKLHIIESSPVNFPCNEQARMLDIQKSLRDGDNLSKSDLRHLLQSSHVGLSKREIDKITAFYRPEEKNDEGLVIELGSLLANASFCK
ncbi:putative prohead protease [Vibrio phage 489E54-1]|nr:putative prohead protease [Vibrio phage 489E54-1]